MHSIQFPIESLFAICLSSLFISEMLHPRLYVFVMLSCKSLLYASSKVSYIFLVLSAKTNILLDGLIFFKSFAMRQAYQNVALPQVDPEASERLAAAKLSGARSTCFACKNIHLIKILARKLRGIVCKNEPATSDSIFVSLHNISITSLMYPDSCFQSHFLKILLFCSFRSNILDMIRNPKWRS